MRRCRSRLSALIILIRLGRGAPAHLTLGGCQRSGQAEFVAKDGNAARAARKSGDDTRYQQFGIRHSETVNLPRLGDVRSAPESNGVAQGSRFFL